jgi:tetratricopeptide (TPR) repeat protein
LSALLALPHERRELILRNSPRAYVLAEELARHCFSLRFHDLREMMAAGRLATEVAGRLTARQTGRSEGELGDLRAYAWAVLGNALRIKGYFGLAGQALATAEHHLCAGTGTRRDLAALLLEFAASLRAGERDFEEAQALLARAHELRVALGDRHGPGKVQIQQGIVTGRAGDPEHAVRLLFEALHLVQDEPDLARAGLQNLICQLLVANQADRARTVLARARGPLEEGGRLFQLKLQWLDAKLADAAGSCHPVLLWQRYHRIRADFASEGWLEEAALVALDVDRLLRADPKS